MFRLSSFPSKKVKTRLFSILQDSWGVLLMMLASIYLAEHETSSSIFDLFSPERLVALFQKWIDNSSMSPSMTISIVSTTLGVCLLLSLVISLPIFILHITHPKASKIISNVLLPFVVMAWCGKEHFYIVTISILFSVYNLLKTVLYFDSYAYHISRAHSYSLLSQSYFFYLKIFMEWLLIIVDIVIVRMSNLSGSSPFKGIIFIMYMGSFVYSTAYSLRSSLAIYYADTLLPSTELSSVLDPVYFYFNSRCFAIWKCFSLIFTIFDNVYSILFNTDGFRFIENVRSSLFLCVLKRKSFINYMFFTKEKVWYGEVRRKMKRVNLREDLLSSILICWLIFHFCIDKIQYNLIRIHESFIILFTNYFIFIEIFNSYIFLSIYKTNYGIDRNRLICEQSESISYSVELLPNESRIGNLK